MNTLASVFKYIKGPAALGLLSAVLAALVFPQHFPLPAFDRFYEKSGENENSAFSGPVSYADAVKKAAPSVVNIYTLKSQPPRSRRRNPFTGKFEQRLTPNSGSGVIVSAEGYIVTNLHVLEAANQTRVVLQDGREAIPRNIGMSIDHDMAILQIDLDDIQAIEIADPDEVQVGDVVLAIGNPFGVGQTVTQGIISGTRRKGFNIARYENFLQTDAAINPGSSGGALVNTRGQLLGINIGDLKETKTGYASGIGFAIPSDRVMQRVKDIIEYGRVVGGWLGVKALDLNPILIAEFNLNVKQGILITDIYTNGPADIAGLLPGDIITALNGNVVDSIATASQEFGDLGPGDVLAIDIVRAGKPRKLEAVLSAEPGG